MQQIHHKKNELFEVEFYKDKEYMEAFDFTNAKNLYIEFVNGDATPLTKFNGYDDNIFTPYLAKGNIFLPRGIKTLDDITPNLSKYIPEDNAVLFFHQEECAKYNIANGYIYYAGTAYDKDGYSKFDIHKSNKLTIFLAHGTQSELQKANEVAKELQEKYGVEEVNLFVLHCFVEPYYSEKYKELRYAPLNSEKSYDLDIINKIITTNSTGILPVQDKERLQVIDCKEIFEEYLKTER